MNINLNKELKELKKISSIESVVLFGSYARDEAKETSDIDLLIISNKKIDEIELENKLKKINSKISTLILSKDELKQRIYDFNHQLLTLFYDGKILLDKNKFYYQMENLYLALYRKKEFTLKFRKNIITLKKLRRLKAYT